MLLDQVTSYSANVTDQIDGLAPGARDEFAYVVLVGLLGTVPASLVSGEFRIGQLRRYGRKLVTLDQAAT